jgi:hypothetical protein
MLLLFFIAELAGWPLLVFVHYRIARSYAVSQALVRAAVTCIVVLGGGIYLGDMQASLASTSPEAVATRCMTVLCYSWFFAPYIILAGAAFRHFVRREPTRGT